MGLWGALAARLHDQTLTIPAHPRLLAELRGLRTELFAYGAAWRVLDGFRKLHRGVAVSLAGACLAAAAVPPYEPVKLWGGNDAVAMTPEALEADEALTRQVSAEWLQDKLRRGGGSFFPGVDWDDLAWVGVVRMHGVALAGRARAGGRGRRDRRAARAGRRAR